MKPQQKISVKKFGGTSVGSLERIENVARRVIDDFKKNPDLFPVVVVSAMSGETNRLVQMAETLNPHFRGPAYDMLLASGEQVSVSLLAMAFEKLGYKAQPFLAHQLGILTDSIYSKARIKTINDEKIFKSIERKIIPVIAGFQGVDEFENITTLGRGGSDTTAVALAAALNAQECEIFTDVTAVFSADPRLIPRAREIKKISYEEMMEMASLGSKVLHIRCVEMAAKFGVPIHVRSSFELREGTWIVPEGDTLENAVVTAVTHDSNTVVFKLFPLPAGTQILAELFRRLSEQSIVVDIITQSRDSDGNQHLAFSIPRDDEPLTLKVIHSIKEKWNKIQIEKIENVSKLSIVGVGMRNHPGVASRFFGVLADKGIAVHLVTTSEIKVSAIIESDRLREAAESIHGSFELDA